MVKEPKRFLVRILDLTGFPVHLQLCESPEDGIEIFKEMEARNEFLDDEDIFQIEQGAEVLMRFEIPHKGASDD